MNVRTAEPSHRRVARFVTEVFSPVVLVVGQLFLIAWHSASSGRQAVALGFVAVLFASLIPQAFLAHGIRRGRLSDRHLRLREQRPAMMALGLVSVIAGLVLLAAWDAPRELVALVAAMVVGLVATLVVTLRWKVSVHAAVAGGTATILVLVFGAILLPGWLLVAAIGWSRVELGEHTPAQVAVGTVLGGTVAAVVFSLLR